ncbi:hypothetical protein EFY87_05710 [Flexivirga caeni]|uniref:Uncharacterized protein n=1 Tax=Flexivirga caeni TaxID=2294115 RepID=A0A3M9MGJ3_9MICO|nr:hypothetical protein EFY87_05710 [Flexivirga caeni]
MTVVFGFNGSGKSGYARLIKQMVRTRHHETILPDVFGDVRQEREGFLDYSVGDVSDEADLADAPPLPLGRVTFYDEKCGDAYLTTESEISYRPSALTLLDDLYEACEGVRRELDRMLAENDRAGVRLPAFESGSPSAVFADTLTWDTSDEQIETACRLPADHADEMVRLQTEESRLRSTDPSKEQARFRRVAADVKTVVAHLMSLEDRLGAESVAELRSRQSAAQGLRGSAGVWVIVRR